MSTTLILSQVAVLPLLVTVEKSSSCRSSQAGRGSSRPSWGRPSRSNSGRCSKYVYRVTHSLVHLGWVDLDLKVPPSFPTSCAKFSVSPSLARNTSDTEKQVDTQKLDHHHSDWFDAYVSIDGCHFTNHPSQAPAQQPSLSVPRAAPVSSSASGRVIRSGIGGIERSMEAKAKATDTQISKAFKDLDQLMDMAKPMVSLAKNISGKIRVGSWSSIWS